MKVYSLISFFIFSMISELTLALPRDFVYLHDIDPTILQEMRYAGSHNFIGRPVKGYQAAQCILTSETAHVLSLVQQQLLRKNLTLKVYDCYRPTMAVTDFVIWSRDNKHNEMKQEFYPTINKADVFRLGYVADKSGHSRGSTVDLTIVPIPVPRQAIYKVGQALVACTAPYAKRFHDNSIDMGTGYDCLNEMAYPFNVVKHSVAYQHRMLLREIMMRHHFQPYEKEWWHFTLANERYPATYFNFPVS